jgi:YYY domain-containing protein
MSLILAVALGLRVYGINWDSGYGFHPDERSLYMRAGCMYDVLVGAPGYRNCIQDFLQTRPGLPSFPVFLDADRSPLNPHWFPLGSVLIYTLVFFRSIIELFADINALDMRYVGRTLSALADVGTVFLAYVLGRRMFSQGVGLLAAALTALAVVHIQNSHFYRPETFSVFFTLASFWAMLRMVECRRFQDSLLLGVMVGLAMAPKISVLPLLLPLGLAYGYWARDAAGGRWSSVTPEILQRMATHAAVAGGTALSVFLFLTPYALLDFTAFIADLAAQTNMAGNAGLWPFTVQYIDTPAFLYQIQQTAVWGLGLPLGLVAWASIPFTAVMAFRSPETRRADLLLLAWVVPQFAFLESFEVHFLRYVFPLMPFLILMGAGMLLWLVGYSHVLAEKARNPFVASLSNHERISGFVSFDKLRTNGQVQQYLPGVAVALVALVVGATAFYALAFERIYANQHPAIKASQWIQQNIPSGTVIVSDNHWDEFIPELYRYQIWQFPAYDPDSQLKMDTLARHLSRAEYLVFYSNRSYGSIARAPERYPLSSSYYQQLFRGELGYRLERAFTSYPELLGISFQDNPYDRAGLPEPEPLVPTEPSPVTLNLGYADDNVIGYDHPQVLLFRNVEHMPKAALQAQLAGGRWAAQQSGQEKIGLLLSEEQKEIQRSGGTWSDLFDRSSWANQFPVLPWLLAVELLYLATLPLAMFIFRPLPDRGIVLARVLGLLGVGYVTWLIVSLGLAEFSRTAILIGVLVISSLSVLALTARWRESKEFLGQHWQLLLLGEALFLIAFLAFVGVRALNPDLWHPYLGGEKPMELAYLNAVVRSTAFPPYDPWFAGGYLNYYYWGYFIVALPIRITGIIPTTAFNLAVPLFFALTLTGAYSLVYNLAQGASRRNPPNVGTGFKPVPTEGGEVHPHPDPLPSRNREKIPGSPITAGLIAGLFIAVMGNLDGMVQLGQGVWQKIFNPGLGFPPFDFWRSSRMIPPLENIDPSPLAFWVPDKIPDAPDISWHITEFPFFTFLFADLHAHMMVIPFTLLVIGLGLALMVGLRNAGWLWAMTSSAVLGLALGSLWVINSWDYPSYLGLVVTLIWLAVYLRRGTATRKLALFGVLAVVIVGVSVLAFLPFHQPYETFDAGIAASKWRTPIDRYIGIHGLFLFVVGTFLVYHTRRSLAEVVKGFLPLGRKALGQGSKSSSGPLVVSLSNYERTGGTLQQACPEPAEVAQDERTKNEKVILDRESVSSDKPWKRVYLVLGALPIIYLAVAGYWTAAVLTILLVLTGLAIWDILISHIPDRAYAVLPLVLLALALAIGIGVDLVRLNGDIGRMNTLFKLYLEAWVLFSIAAGYMLWRLRTQGWLRGHWSWGKSAWVGVLALLVASSLIYTGLGTPARLANRFERGPVTLKGSAYMNNAIHWEEDQRLELKWDLEAIQWLQENVQGSPVVLEAHNEQYHWSSRIVDYTGLPTVLGWPWHQIQQRFAYADAVHDRAKAVQAIYNTTDLSLAQELLRKYEVEYIVVGGLERAYYSPEGLEKFDEMVGKGLVKCVVDNKMVKIYRTLW